METKQILEGFKLTFSKENDSLYFSPGRINLIGEHTDYNGGHVFPSAIGLGTYGAFAKREDNIVKLFSNNLPDAGVISFDVDNLSFDKKYGWSNYLRGMILEIGKLTDKKFSGFDLYLEGDLPDGAGLSSSASIEMLMGTILNEEYSLNIDPLEIVKAGKRVENNYIGVNTGIMDQFAVEMGRKDQAIFLDTNTMEYEYSPIDLGDYRILIMNTNKPHELASSKYNERRSECEEALVRLQTKLDIKSLGELDVNKFDQYTSLINDRILISRARHAVFENQRTIQAKKALDNKQLELFGRLVNASHISLQYDYEVSADELDFLVDSAWKFDGVLGARMIGGGFGGCAIAIVQKDQIDGLIKQIGPKYKEQFGYAADFYETQIVDGPHKYNGESNEN
ncbi:galactokinase [Pediococcus claussenii]|uniref:Galactokinase n=1 Tax=Pediococcus claussenii (strain ATCC BAA-344 / DSM 14800 / JCM 18046 / KCTC 3811 / LMG 21948 / P06) TaxID=701521 RepID=G8PB09_PEDCP|nr:galactokinase [Pediococcus claussenii]AEV95877.1 galactokinase [Pediococcus claussenii ATCC BAA-344]ANZ69372.1 galactokinase [Pediococcus claussenii]ANZ71192.1 galactokinase [Pediococcus claussenii]KRN20484.1 galK protein [Pediococcus claussenii]